MEGKARELNPTRQIRVWCTRPPLNRNAFWYTVWESFGIIFKHVKMRFEAFWRSKINSFNTYLSTWVEDNRTFQGARKKSVSFFHDLSKRFFHARCSDLNIGFKREIRLAREFLMKEAKNPTFPAKNPTFFTFGAKTPGLTHTESRTLTLIQSSEILNI